MFRIRVVRSYAEILIVAWSCRDHDNASLRIVTRAGDTQVGSATTLESLPTLIEERSMKKRTKQTATAIIALIVATLPALAMADFDGSDEELAQELGKNLKEIAFIADSISKVEEGEKAPVDRAMALIDWLYDAAKEIEQRFEKGAPAHVSDARALAEAARNADKELRAYAKEASSPELCEKSLRRVMTIGGTVLEHLGSK